MFWIQDRPGAGFLRPASPAILRTASWPGLTPGLSTLSAAKNFEHSMQRSRTTNHQRCCNPKGIVSASPGLRGTSYPGWRPAAFPTPTGLRLVFTVWPQPRWGCLPLPRCPRVARSSQPWASGRNPFGIRFWNFRSALKLVYKSRDVVAATSGYWYQSRSRTSTPLSSPTSFLNFSTSLPR